MSNPIMKHVIFSLTLFFAVGLIQAGEKIPLSATDLLRQEAATDFKISPRGDEAVYVRSWYDVKSPGRRTSLWRIDGGTGTHAPLEAGEPDSRMPVYSPDGNWLAFVSSRTTIDAPRPDDVPVYSDPTGAVWIMHCPTKRLAGPFGGCVLNDPFYGRLAFAPNSKMLMFVAGSNYFGEPIKRSPTEDDQGEGYEGYDQMELHVLDLRDDVGWAFHSKTPYDPAWFGDPQWLPDGKRYLFHANRTADQESVRFSINKNYDLWMGTIGDGRANQNFRRLTNNPGPDVSPRISPDGKHVLYLSVPRKGPHADVYNLCVLSLEKENTEPMILVNAHAADNDADGTPPFQPTFPLRDDSWIDNEHVRVRGTRGMKGEMFVFNIGGPQAAVAATVKREPQPPANKHLVPPALNAWQKERLEAREEIVKWKSFDGLEIEGVLTLPPAELTAFKAPYPTIAFPHGGPHSASRPGFNFAVHLFAANGYAVFQPNFRGSYGYGRKFLDAARFDMGGSDMQDILTGIDQLIARSVVDANRQFVYGISYGGYSTCRLVTITDRFRAAVTQNAVTDLHAMWSLSDIQSWTEWEFGGKPWETIEHAGKKIDVGALMRERSPTTLAHKVRTPTLILHCDHDRRCPLAMGQMFYRHLKESGCETELVIYKDDRHSMVQVKHQVDVLQRVLAWFAKHSGTKP